LTNLTRHTILYNYKGYANKNKTQTETLKQLTKTQKELITIKNTIKEMYNTERTHIGHNVLAQLMEAIQ